jgi:hypothetical protein
MKKTLIFVIFFLVAILVFQLACKRQLTSLESDEDFINFAIEADKRLMTVFFVRNPENLIKHGLKPTNIETRDDVYKIMLPYWDSEFIERIWQEGSRFEINNLPFGFYTEGNWGLLDAVDIKLKSKTSDKVIVSGRVKSMYGRWKDREIILIRTNQRWKAKLFQ